MSEFYNPHDHDFVERSDEQLQARLAELHINNNRIHYTGDRLKHVQREIGNISFELSERFRENKNQEIEEAWSQVKA